MTACTHPALVLEQVEVTNERGLRVELGQRYRNTVHGLTRTTEKVLGFGKLHGEGMGWYAFTTRNPGGIHISNLVAR